MCKVLVVDDETKIREVIREYAEFEGHYVTEASNGMEAINICKIEDFDIIVMDIMMPKLDGFSASKSTYFSPLSAMSFIIFTLLYIPCLSTVAIIQKELGSRKWTLFSIGYALIIAYILTFIIYQFGQWLGFN